MSSFREWLVFFFLIRRSWRTVLVYGSKKGVLFLSLSCFLELSFGTTYISFFVHRLYLVGVLCLTNSCFFFACLQQKALEAAMNDINNSFGKGSVTRLGSAGGALV